MFFNAGLYLLRRREEHDIIWLKFSIQHYSSSMSITFCLIDVNLCSFISMLTKSLSVWPSLLSRDFAFSGCILLNSLTYSVHLENAWCSKMFISCSFVIRRIAETTSWGSAFHPLISIGCPKPL